MLSINMRFSRLLKTDFFVQSITDISWLNEFRIRDKRLNSANVHFCSDLSMAIPIKCQLKTHRANYKFI